jgi:integrase
MACIRERRDRLVIDYYDQTGKRRWETLPEGTTKTKAKERLTDIMKEVQDGNHSIPIDKTIEAVSKEWLKAKQIEVRKHTVDDYESTLRNHIWPYFVRSAGGKKEPQSIKIQKITSGTVRQFIIDMTKKGLSIRNIEKCHIVLGSLMEYARAEGYINHNPVRGVKKPKADTQALDPNGNGNGKEIKPLTSEQVRTILDTIPDSEIMHKTLNMVAVFSGMREGEILGLKWDDILSDSNQIDIKRTYTHGAFYNPKTKQSRRRIDVPPVVINQLKRWKVAQSPNELDLVFANGKGEPIDGGNMPREMFTPYLKNAGLPIVNFHSLRHTYASLLIEQGENIKYIQKQLGHSKATVTLDIYGHLMNDSNPEASGKLEEKIFGSNMVANES